MFLTFNVRTENANFTDFRNIGVTFGGQYCILGTGSPANRVPISGAQFFESQVKVEVIRGSNSTVGYARVSLCEIDFGNGPACYHETNLLTGLDFDILNNFLFILVIAASSDHQLRQLIHHHRCALKRFKK